MTAPFIWTCFGTHIDLIAPRPEQIHRSDIARSLSRQQRWTGHVRVPWSVAEHSIVVSYMVPAEYARLGLLHDAHEMICGDVSSPLKAAMRMLGYEHAFDRIEYRAADAVGKAMGVDLVNSHPLVKAADRNIMQWEASEVMCVTQEEREAHFGPDTLSPDELRDIGNLVREIDLTPSRDTDAEWVAERFIARLDEV